MTSFLPTASSDADGMLPGGCGEPVDAIAYTTPHTLSHVVSTMGDRSPPAAPDEMFLRVYEDLRGLAHRQRRPGDTLNTTALVHELFLRMRPSELKIDPAKFYAYAARAMRNLLIDRARLRLREKRGSGAAHLEIDANSAQEVSIDATEALELDDALRSLEVEDERAAQVVELHYFAGLTLEHIGELLGLTRRTVDRDLQFARTYLKSQYQA